MRKALVAAGLVQFLKLCVLALAVSLPTVQAQQVYRCGNNYSAEPCSGGKAVDVSPPVRNLDAVSKSEAYLCVSNSGGRFWSPEHCRERGAQIDRIESVPAGLPWDQQVKIAEQQARQGYAIQRQNVTQHGGATAGTTGRDPSRCAHFNQQVEQLDIQARQPQSTASLGWIAQQRKDVRDRQHRAGC
ncbi:MAG: hypothetical protein JSS14_10320 [Proteobacteria bacterium]|nr:hypothetical protein [Pseudomonadota bacterium]